MKCTWLRAAAAAVVASLPATAASQEAQRMRVRFGGFHQQWLTIVDQDFHDSNPTSYRRNLNVVDEYHNSEIWLLGEAIVSGGITIGLKIEMEANSNTNEVDKLFAYLSKNTVGRVTVGNENNAAILLRVTAPSGGIGIDDGDVIGGFFRVPEAFILDNTALNVTSLRFGDGDSGKFTYITPDFGGFQAALLLFLSLKGARITPPCERLMKREGGDSVMAGQAA